jgi:phage-related baseplate assembly protein
MTTDNRGVPDISFIDTDTDGIVAALTLKYEELSGRKLYPADPVRLFILWMAGIVAGLSVNIDYSAKMNIPRFAAGKYLDELAELFPNVRRLPPSPARATLRFVLSAAMDWAVVIPEGTRATPDGTLYFATERDLIIPAGGLSGDAGAYCTAVIVTGGIEYVGGKAGNGFLPGAINRLVDLFPYYEAVENITESAGGADFESDDALYARMRESMDSPSTAGAMGSYSFWAKTASALVSDVAVFSPAPGVVDVRVLLQDGEFPPEEVLDLVRETLTAEEVRPLTDLVTVAAPEAAGYAVDFTYYIQPGGNIPAAALAANVAAAVEEYRLWQSERLGRDINPSRLEYLVMAAGVKRVVIRSPVFTPVEDNAAAVLTGEPSVINGGYESG